MRWSDFLRERAAQIGAFLLIFVIFTVSFLLWHLPLAALLNPTGLALVVFVAYLAIAYFRWRATALRLRELTARVEELTEQLAAKELLEHERADLLRVWSHQMKVPLAAIDLMAQTTVDEKALKAQVFRLENYLRILLESIRIQNLTTDFRFEELSVSTLTKVLIKKYSPFFIQKGLTVQVDGDWQLTTDARWLSLALEQLINNALKYTETGGLTVRISTGFWELIDTGIGILPEDLPRLFEHGFTGFNGRAANQKSSGLGFYLAKQILDKLDFQIAVDSKLGQGTTVTVRKSE